MADVKVPSPSPPSPTPLIWEGIRRLGRRRTASTTGVAGSRGARDTAGTDL